MSERRPASARRRAVGWVLAAALVAAAAVLVHRLRDEGAVVAHGLVPEPLAPFGLVHPAEIRFEWAVPEDAAPVRVEVCSPAPGAPHEGRPAGVAPPADAPRSDSEAGRDALFADAPRVLWSSEATRGGSFSPPRRAVDTWPAEDLLWRPVAVPAGAPERPGDYAAFTLSGR